MLFSPSTSRREFAILPFIYEIGCNINDFFILSTKKMIYLRNSLLYLRFFLFYQRFDISRQTSPIYKESLILPFTYPATILSSIAKKQPTFAQRTNQAVAHNYLLEINEIDDHRKSDSIYRKRDELDPIDQPQEKANRNQSKYEGANKSNDKKRQSLHRKIFPVFQQ